MDQTIKILLQTIVNNVAAKIGSVHNVPVHMAYMYVLAGNPEYVKERATNRAVGGKDSDAMPKQRAKK